jgi:hypothetical protein
MINNYIQVTRVSGADRLLKRGGATVTKLLGTIDSAALLSDGELDQFDIDVRLSATTTFVDVLARQPRAEDWPSPPDNPEPFPTQGEITCEAACNIPSGVPECHPGTDDCCQGGASIIPISNDAFTCDCPDTATCQVESE